MSGLVTFSYRDYQGEVSTVSVPIPDTDETNFEERETEIGAFMLALENIVIGQRFKEVCAWRNEIVSGDKATDKQAQRETKWLVRMVEDDTFHAVTMEIPCADLSLLPAAGATGELPIDSGVGAVFKGALENLYLTDRGKRVTVKQILHVGRNL